MDKLTKFLYELGVALMMIKNSRALIFRLCAYLLIFFWGVIKLFPIFGLTVILEKKRNLFLFLSAIFAAAFITYFLASIGEIKTISQAFDVERVWFRFGHQALFLKVKPFLSNLSLFTGGETDIKKMIRYMMYIIMSLLTLWLFVTWYGSIGRHKSTKSLSGKISRKNQNLRTISLLFYEMRCC